MLMIGVATAGFAFIIGWTALRRRDAAAGAPGGFAGPARDPFVSGGAHERRNAARRGGHPITVQMTDPDEKLPQQHAWVLDRSVGGLCLRVPRAVPIGTFWKVRPTAAPPTTPPVRVEVKTCIRLGSEWKLNCHFEKTPSYAVLLMFG
jgi:hypothetical protein